MLLEIPLVSLEPSSASENGHHVWEEVSHYYWGHTYCLWWLWPPKKSTGRSHPSLGAVLWKGALWKASLYLCWPVCPEGKGRWPGQVQGSTTLGLIGNPLSGQRWQTSSYWSSCSSMRKAYRETYLHHIVCLRFLLCTFLSFSKNFMPRDDTLLTFYWFWKA